MYVANENKVINVKGKELVLTPNDYLLDKSVVGQDVLILKREAIDKIEEFFELEVVPYEKGNTTILPNTIVYNNTMYPSIVEHAFVRGAIRGDKLTIVEGVGEANPLTVSKDFAGYIGTMARKRAISNAVVRFFVKYMLANEKDNPILSDFNIYSQDEWKNAKNDFTIQMNTPVAPAVNAVETVTEAPVAEEVQNVNITNPADFVFTSGKHKGETLAKVAETDEGYLNWLVENRSDTPAYADTISAIKAYKNK